MKFNTLVLAFALAGFGSAYAQPAPSSAGHDPVRVAAAAAMHKTCAADQDKLCPNMIPHDALACMRKNMSQLSTPCQKAINDLPPGKDTTPKP